MFVVQLPPDPPPEPAAPEDDELVPPEPPDPPDPPALPPIPLVDEDDSVAVPPVIVKIPVVSSVHVAAQRGMTTKASL